MISTGDPEAVARASQDYIRTVVAHEAGHTMGLRHNFAGSAASELASFDDEQKKWKDYISAVDLTGALTSSSVMDYLPGSDSILFGAAIKSRNAEHDMAAIRWGYSPAPVSVADLHAPLFCTDIEMYTTHTLGCQAFDGGKNPIEYYAHLYAKSIDTLDTAVLAQILESIRPEFAEDSQSVQEAATDLDPQMMSALISNTNVGAYQLLSSTGRVLSVDRELGGKAWFNKDDYAKKTLEAQASSVVQLGGFSKWLRLSNGTSPEQWKAGWLKERLLSKIHSPEFAKGTDSNGRDYALTSTELDQIAKYGSLVSDQIETALLRDAFVSLTGGNPLKIIESAGQGPSLFGAAKDPTYAKGFLDADAQKDLGSLVASYVMATEGTIAGTLDGKPVSVPKPKLSLELRKTVLRFFESKYFGAPDDWMKDEKSDLGAQLTSRVLLVAKLPAVKTPDASPSGVPSIIPGVLPTLTFQGITGQLTHPRTLAIGTPPVTPPATPSLDGVDASDELKAWAKDELDLIKVVAGKDTSAASPFAALFTLPMPGLN